MRARRGSETIREDEDWYTALYEQVVADRAVQARAIDYAETMRLDGDPEISMSDVQASRAYLRACIFSMSQTEASEKRPDDLAALWARGALGAAKYRSGKSHKPTRRRRAKDRDA